MRPNRFIVTSAASRWSPPTLSKYTSTPSRAACHRLAELERGDVGGDVIHPAPHIRVDGQPGVAHQDLSRPRIGHLGPQQAEVGGLRLAGRTCDQLPLTAGNRHGLLLESE